MSLFSVLFHLAEASGRCHRAAGNRGVPPRPRLGNAGPSYTRNCPSQADHPWCFTVTATPGARRAGRAGTVSAAEAAPATLSMKQRPGDFLLQFALPRNRLPRDRIKITQKILRVFTEPRIRSQIREIIKGRFRLIRACTCPLHARDPGCVRHPGR